MINVYLLGRFEIIVNGKKASQVLNSSKKGKLLLQYLLLHKEESITSSDLCEVLWPNDSSANPESALKTLVSRIRAILNQFDENLGKCIVTSRGAYRWNNELECTVDVLAFEARCQELLRIQTIDEAIAKEFEDVLGMYVGDLSRGNEGETWFVSRSTYYHTLYLRLAAHTVRLMKPQNQLEAIIRICRRALDIDSFDETMHLELMDALVRSNRSNEALIQYRHATNLHYNYLGIRPPERIQNFYKHIIQADQSLGMDISSIRKALQEGDAESGAFICEYAIFKDIYRLLIRNFSRMANGMYLGIVMLSSVDGQTIEPGMLDKAMTFLLRAMRKNLRRGDTITRYSSSQYALLLPAVNNETGRIILERIRTAFYNQYSETSLTFSYKIGPMEEVK